MSVNGVTSPQAAELYSTYAAPAASGQTAAESTASSQSSREDVGAVYEPSKQTVTNTAKKTYTPNTDLVNKLKADAEARTAQLRSLVEKMLTKQSTTYANANDIWSLLGKGSITVDPATRLQAQEDISEDGYWGVKQTSDRIIQFATALTGGDPDKIEEMRNAFLKGYKQAEKTWGGQLPDISRQTYDAVMKKFDDLAAQAGLTVDQEATK